jgi:8-oxo-dGTP pyrophosphatase MutT (NUDIX family)
MTDEAPPAAPEKKPQALKPQDAATLIIVDRSSTGTRVLMGRRRLDQVFMPGKYVFPGGRVDKQDRLISSHDELRPAELQKLLVDMKGTVSAARARAIALASIRETFEEAGIVIGAETPATGGDLPHETWRSFFGRGFAPRLAELTFFARAITPPGRPRRYDTRFFCVDARAITARLDMSDGELSAIEWVTVDQARELDLPPITRVILEDLLDRLDSGRLEDGSMAIPYYHHKNGSFRRELLRVG